MKDPKHTGNGFYNINDVESIIRAITDAAEMRLFNSIQVREGKQLACAQVERDLHVCIMAKHRYGKYPFHTVRQLVQYVMDYKPQNDKQDTMKEIMLCRLPSLEDANDQKSSNCSTS